MHDKSFRGLDHRLGSHDLHSRGEELARGYAPDLVATREGYVCLIMENEPRCDAKAILGAYLKAEKFAVDTQASPSLVFVLREKRHALLLQMTEQLRQFAGFWRIQNAGALKEVLLISDAAYVRSLQKNIAVLSAEFRAQCQIVALKPAGASPAAAKPEPRAPEPEPVHV